MKYKVGKPRFKFSIAACLIFIYWSIWLLFFCPFKPIRFFGIFLIIIILIIVLPCLTFSNSIWEVTEQHLSFAFYNNIFEKIKCFFIYVFTKNLDYQTKIRIDKIMYIRVTYEKVPMIWYIIDGYNVIFNVVMKDGSTFSFQPIVTQKRKEVIDAVEFLKKEGIIFKDHYHILNQLDKKVPISYYLEKIAGDKK